MLSIEQIWLQASYREFIMLIYYILAYQLGCVGGCARALGNLGAKQVVPCTL